MDLESQNSKSLENMLCRLSNVKKSICQSGEGGAGDVA